MGEFKRDTLNLAKSTHPGNLECDGDVLHGGKAPDGPGEVVHAAIPSPARAFNGNGLRGRCEKREEFDIDKAS